MVAIFSMIVTVTTVPVRMAEAAHRRGAQQRFATGDGGASDFPGNVL
ncbi:hypothetical protein [Tatumella ptyseos]|nr:hypothetical protein [Tatumella ptyseos]